MWLFYTQSHTSTLWGYEAPRKNAKAENRKRRTEEGKQATENPAVLAESADARAIAFLRLARGMGKKGPEKGSGELPRDNKIIDENNGVEGGIVENLASRAPSCPAVDAEFYKIGS